MIYKLFKLKIKIKLCKSCKYALFLFFVRLQNVDENFRLEKIQKELW